VLVPKAATHFDDSLQPWEDQIRLAGEVRNVEPVPESFFMNKTANDHLR